MIDAAGRPGGQPTAPAFAAAVRVLPSAGQVQRAAAEIFADAAVEAVRARGRFTVALAGGSTPRGAYELLAREPLRGRIPWSNVHVFWGDERHVPPDHPDSNYRMAREALLAHVPLPEGNVHRIPAENSGASVAAAAYEQTLLGVFATSAGKAPRFDLILLGMGPDGHTASLFPGGRALKERERLAVAEHVECVGGWRITLTLPVLNAAAQVVFLVTGAEKAAALATVLGPEGARSRLPAALVRPPEGRLSWLVDGPAARLLETDRLDAASREPRGGRKR
jgi:6-phosphogluconolactonase